MIEQSEEPHESEISHGAAAEPGRRLGRVAVAAAVLALVAVAASGLYLAVQLRSQVDDLEAAAVVTRSDLASAQASLTTAQGRVAALSGQVDRRLSDLEVRVGGGFGVGNLSGRIDRVESDIGTLDSNMQSIGSRLGRVESKADCIDRALSFSSSYYSC